MKLGISCSALGGYCHGQTCLNILVGDEELKIIDIYDDFDPKSSTIQIIESDIVY